MLFALSQKTSSGKQGKDEILVIHTKLGIFHMSILLVNFIFSAHGCCPLNESYLTSHPLSKGNIAAHTHTQN